MIKHIPKHIPILCFEEIKIPYTNKPLQWQANLQIEHDIKWFNGVPYKVTIINKGDK